MHDISEFAKLFKKMFDRVCKRDRAAYICAKRGKIAAKMKFAMGPGPADSLTFIFVPFSFICTAARNRNEKKTSFRVSLRL